MENKSSNSIFVATSTFGKYSKEPLAIFEDYKINVSYNPLLRKLNSNELVHYAKNSSGIIAGTEEYTSQVLEQLPKLKIISRLGTGMDNIDAEAAEQRGVKIFKTVTTPAPAVAELALGLMIDIYRSISQSDHTLKNNDWSKQMGSLIQGKTLGVIGMGTIGKALVKLMSGFNLKILAFDKDKDTIFAKSNNVVYCDLDTLLQRSDIISIHLNLTNDTKHLLSKEKIKLMKKDAILLNTSRGGIIDENALYESLMHKRLKGAGLDVFEKEPYRGPLTKLNNVLLTPHIGAYAKEIRSKMEIEAAKTILREINEI